MSQRETVLDVAGMSCSSCVRHVSAALQAIPGVARAEVRLKAGTVSVWHEAAVSVSCLVEALGAAGYEARIKDDSPGAAVPAPR